jgi:hypothetical protein
MGGAQKYFCYMYHHPKKKKKKKKKITKVVH